MIKGHLILLAVVALAASTSCAPSSPKEAVRRNNQPPVLGDSFDISGDDLYNVDTNNILPYNPVDPKPVRHVVRPSTDGKLQSSSYTDLERESSSSSSSSSAAKKPQSPNVANVMMAEGDDAERSGSPNVDKMKDIALNSREVRLVGPNQKEVEMKDDLPTKVVVALENLQKEAKEVFGQVNDKLDQGWTELKRAEVWGQMNDKLDKGWTDIKRSEVWGQVNEKLDKGWTDFKSMLEGVVSPSTANKSG